MHAAIRLNTLHLSIRGRVQGVGFRYHLQQEALRTGVAGWVRNRRDGSVEAVLHGETEAVQALVEWARHGPTSARVEDVQVEPAAGEYSDFEARPTA
ncbi:MAG: acylphosphatase [Betaproteobacteria bacterium]|nr:acylphosphatase [Betaproteobacteria bacterium]